MSFTAPRTRRRPAITLGSWARAAGIGVLLAVALAATTDAPPPAPAPVALAPAVATPLRPGPIALRSAAPRLAAPERVPARLHGGPTTGPAPAAAAGPVRATLPRSEPVRVRIPAIGVDSELVGLGLQEDGRMEVPPGAFPAGWYTGAPTPGELGPAVLAGHVDYGGAAGVFARLHDLRPGDSIEVAREDGDAVIFRVTRVEQHRKDAFPTAAVYGDIDHAGLRLVTCGGPFDRRAHSYEDNIVVFAELDLGPGTGAGA